MEQMVVPTKINEFHRRILYFLILFSSVSMSLIQCALYKVDDPKFIAGYKFLFAQKITSYPYSGIYSITYYNPLQSPSTYYDVVLSINAFNFFGSNTIAWNFTKSNVSETGFMLKYEAGVNSIIYELGINYMVIDNSYGDIQIAYFSIYQQLNSDYTCSILNTSAGYRSQNISYQINKFSNDKDYVKTLFLESFNLTNTQNDFMTFRHAYHQSNMTVIVQLYVNGLFKIHQVQFYLVLHDKSRMYNTYERIVYLKQYQLLTSISDYTTMNNALSADHKQKNRLFSGLSAFNMTKVGSKKLYFKFNQNQAFDFVFLSTNGGNLQDIYYSVLAIYSLKCDSGEAYDQATSSCLALCPSSTYLDVSRPLHQCKKCHYSCQTCQNYLSTGCKLCPATRYQDIFSNVSGVQLYSCKCDLQHFDQYLAACPQCQYYISGCMECTDNATCTKCNAESILTNQNKCICKNSAQNVYFMNLCKTRVKGCQTHIQKSGQLICSECYVQRNFTITSLFRCQCNNLWQEIVDITGFGDYRCLYICGDGYLSDNEQCDDGNNIAGDGCTQQCVSERNFTCSSVLTEKSFCEYNLKTQLIFLSSQRVLHSNIQNTVVLNFTLQPYISYMSQFLNLSSIVTTSILSSNIQHYFNCPSLYKSLKCNLTLTINYLQDIESKASYIYLNLSQHPKIIFDSSTLYFVPQGNIAMLTYQKEQTLGLLSTVEVVVLVLVVISIIVFLTSIYFQKMIGVQLIMTVQFIYYLFTTIKNNPIQFLPLERNLRYSTGYNQLYNYTFYRYQPLPNQLNHQYVQKQFILNVNIMLVGLLLILFVMVLAKIIKICISMFKKTKNQSKFFYDDGESQNKRKFDIFYNFFWNKIFFTYVFFVMYQVLFNCVITTILQNATQTYFPVSFNFIAAFLSLFVIITGILSVGYWYYQQNRQKGRIAIQQNRLIPYKFDLCKKQYILIYTSIQPLKIWIVALFYSQPQCLYIVLSLSSIYFVFLAIYRPYKNADDTLSNMQQNEPQQIQPCISIHNFGACFNQFCIISFAVLCLVWNVSVDNYDFHNGYPDIVLYCTIAILSLLNVVAILRIFYKKISALLFCQTFKKNNPNASNFQNAFAKMRKIIRDDDQKGLDLNQLKQNQNCQKNADKSSTHKKQRMKILQEIKKQKNFFINNWKDDVKPKYFQQNATQKQQSIIQNGVLVVQNSQKSKKIDKVNDNSFLKMKKIDQKNSGLVQMQTLMKGLNQSNYNIGRTTQKKTAELKKSFLHHLLDKKQAGKSSKQYTRKNTIIGEIEEQQKKKEPSNINDVKQKLRQDFA